MFSTFFTVALFVAPAIQGVFADFAVNSPELTQCKETKLSWEKTGAAPYNLIIVKASDPCGNALVDIGDVNTTFYNWDKVKIKAGTQVQVSLIDANDDEAWSQVLTVKDSDDNSCLSGNSTTGGSSSASTPSSTSKAASNTVLPSATSSSTSSDGTDDSDGSNINPVGAANAGTQPFGNSGITARQASTPLLALAGLAAVAILL